MTNTKALEVARKWAADTITLKDDGLSVSIAITFISNIIQTAIDDVTADLRAQLAEQDALIQKHLSTLTSLEAAVKERDAQLAAERAHKAEITQMLSWLVKDIRDTAKEQKIKGAELYENPCYGIGLHAWHKATAYLGLRVVTGATRQSTQDKGK